MSGAPLDLSEIGTKLTKTADSRLLKVVALIDRAGQRGPVARLLDPVRPRLAALQPPRPATLERVLVLPFQDLLVAAEDRWPGRRRISRALLPELVRTVLIGLDAPLACELCAELSDREMRAAAPILAVGVRLWPEAAKLLRASAVQLDQDRAAQLGGAVALLALGPSLVPAVWQLPARPMTTLPDGTATMLAPIVASARHAGPDSLMWLLELLLARSLASDLVLDLIQAPAFGLAPAEREACTGSLVHDRIIAMRRTANRLRDAVARSTAEIVDQLVELVADLEALDTRWVDSTGDRQQLEDVRTATADLVTRRLERTVGGDLIKGFEALGGPAGADDDAVEQLEQAARSVRRLGLAGAQLGLTKPSRDLFQPYLDAYRERFRSQASAASDAGKTASSLEQIRIVEILFGSDTAMALLDELRESQEGLPNPPSAGPPARRSPGPRPSARPAPSPQASRMAPLS